MACRRGPSPTWGAPSPPVSAPPNVPGNWAAARCAMSGPGPRRHPKWCHCGPTRPGRCSSPPGAPVTLPAGLSLAPSDYARVRRSGCAGPTWTSTAGGSRYATSSGGGNGRIAVCKVTAAPTPAGASCAAVVDRSWSNRSHGRDGAPSPCRPLSSTNCARTPKRRRLKPKASATCGTTRGEWCSPPASARRPSHRRHAPTRPRGQPDRGDDRPRTRRPGRHPPIPACGRRTAPRCCRPDGRGAAGLTVRPSPASSASRARSSPTRGCRPGRRGTRAGFRCDCVAVGGGAGASA